MLTPGTSNFFMGDGLSECKLLELSQGDCVVYTRKAPYKDIDGQNEDAAVVVQITEDISALIVADGMGGWNNADTASRLTAQKISEALLNAEPGQINQTVIESLTGVATFIQDTMPMSGTTVTISIIDGRVVTTHHAGDSEAMLLCGKSRKIKMHTIPHSFVGQDFALGVLNEKDALFHNRRHIVLNAVGTPGFYVDSGEPQELKNHDTLLLASDGLHDNLFRREIIDIATGDNLLESARTLVKKCSDRMCGDETDMPCKQDDLTMIMFRSHAPLP